MINLVWKAGFKPDAYASFSTREAAVRWTEQFGNRMDVWQVTESEENSQYTFKDLNDD